MKRSSLLVLMILVSTFANFTRVLAQADKSKYLNEIKAELKKEWPKNRTINLVFHGHSVPSGYFKTPVVNTFGSYPYLVIKGLKEKYPYAVINVIVTAIGGENSVKGEARFASEVLTHKPDVLFIDYALNDRMMGLEKSKSAMTKMIEAALKQGIRIVLLTPSPHQNYNILDPKNAYEPFKDEVTDLAKQYHIGLSDSYSLFKEKINAGQNVKDLMSQVNHPNEKGHQIIADGILEWF